MPRRKERAGPIPRRKPVVECVRLGLELRREQRRLSAPSLPHLVVGAAVEHTRTTDKLCQLSPALTPAEMYQVERRAARNRRRTGWVKPQTVEDATLTIEAVRGATHVLEGTLAQDNPERADKQANPCYTQGPTIWQRFRAWLTKLWGWVA